MSNMVKPTRKPVTSFSITDILGDEICRSKRRREEDDYDEDENEQENATHIRDDRKLMVLESRRVTNEKVTDERNYDQFGLVRQEYPSWVPMFRNTIKCDNEEEAFIDKSKRIESVFVVILC